MEEDRDHTLETLLDLDGFLAEIGEGYWVKIKAIRVKPDREKPCGIKYSLTLHNSDGQRVLGYDNAHSIPFHPSIEANDHKHRSGKIIKYDYKDAVTLLEDFWEDVSRITNRKHK